MEPNRVCPILTLMRVDLPEPGVYAKNELQYCLMERCAWYDPGARYCAIVGWVPASLSLLQSLESHL